MSAQQSYLSQAGLGYDIVFATTQDSINYIMKDYLLNGTFPVITKYYVKDTSGNPVEIAYDQLMLLTNNIDPLNIAACNNSGNNNASLNALYSAGFLHAYKAQLGIPDCLGDLLDQQIINLNADNTVDFNLLCNNFQVVDATYAASSAFISAYANTSQTEAAWIFTYNVPLQHVINNSNLPATVQQQVNNLGNTAFSVKQLMFDFANPAMVTPLSIPGIFPSSVIYKTLNSLFASQYFGAMQNYGAPSLNYSITQEAADPSTLTITDMTFQADLFTDPTSGQPVTDTTDARVGLATLNYECATNGNKLPAAKSMSWNWLDAVSDESVYHGALSISRTAFRNYMQAQLAAYVASNCYMPKISVANVNGADVWSFSLTPSATVDSPDDDGGAAILHYEYMREARAFSTVDSYKWVELICEFDLQVVLTENTIVISRTLLLNFSSNIPATFCNVWILSKTYTQTYEMNVFHDGTILLNALPPSIVDLSKELGSTTAGLSDQDLENLLLSVEAYSQSLSSATFTEVPLGIAQKFVFPGGNTFSFKDIFFSDNFDLAGHITYLTER